MTQKQALWDLLRARANQWVDRDTLDFVGGEDTGRRMRELRTNVTASGQWVLEERRDHRGRLEFRLIPILSEQPEDERARFRYRCKTCGSHPYDITKTQPSLDPRWRLGTCTICRQRTIFEREGTQ